MHTCVVVENLTLSFGCCRGHLQNIPNRKASSHFFSTFHQFHSVISPTFVYLIASLDSKLAVYGRHWYRSPRNEPASLCLRVKNISHCFTSNLVDRPTRQPIFFPAIARFTAGACEVPVSASASTRRLLQVAGAAAVSEALIRRRLSR